MVGATPDHIFLRLSGNGGTQHERVDGTMTRTVGLFLGPAAFLFLLALPPPAELSDAGWTVAAVATWMAIWWVTEAIPLAATALLPLPLMPLLDVVSVGTAAAPYANPLIFLFLGGFLIALAVQRWSLHRRIALHILALSGGTAARTVAALMVATALLSMAISNTASTMLMLPIAASLLIGLPVTDDTDRNTADRRNFAIAGLLGIAYAASIGGVATLIGSPPNALLASFLGGVYGIEVTFAGWMLIGLPLAILMLPCSWLLLTKVIYPFGEVMGHAGQDWIRDELKALGPMTSPEKRVAAVFGLVAAGWILTPVVEAWFGPTGLSDPGIAIAGAIALFAIPADWASRRFLLDWETARGAPWEVLILFGGGLSLAQAIDQSGLALWIGSQLTAFGTAAPVVLIAAVALVVLLLTELTSNTATTAALLPVMGGLAVSMNIDPVLLTLPVALAASCAFMLPVATPPNAIVFGTGHVTIGQMIRAGIWLNATGLVLITLVVYLIGQFVI